MRHHLRQCVDLYRPKTEKHGKTKSKSPGSINYAIVIVNLITKVKTLIHKTNSKANTGFVTSATFFQPKLTINQPNDVYEQEADAMADHVMQSNNHLQNQNTFFKPSFSSVQRKCAHCEEEEKKQVQRKEKDTTTTASSTTENYISSISGNGNKLSPGERNFFEPKFGSDLSNVRIHTGVQANESAKSINALAYTHGNNIVFADNQYQPSTDPGKKLLAHELTHVMQQSQNIAPAIQRQPGDGDTDTDADNSAKENVEKNEVVKKLEEDTFFKKLEKKVKDEIKDAIKHAPEKITEAILDMIIDATVTDPQYNNGLKKAAEAIIKTITNQKPVSTSKCDAIPGYHEGTSKDYKGQCCTGSYESPQTCCPRDKFAPNNAFTNCCKANEVVNAEGKCEKVQPVDPTTICVAPGKKDAMGKCCMPPFEVIDGFCATPTPKEEPRPPSLSLKFTIGVIDDYNIDDSLINSRQKPHFEEVKKQIHQFMEACPASMITLTGFADKPGTEEHNMDLGQHRADHMKMLLQLDLLNVNFNGLSPMIFARSEGENNPVDVKAGENYSSANRRVEIEFNSMCPALGSSSATKPLSDNSLKLGSPLKLREGVF
jgi:flagellar motor protein MotB